MYSKNVYKRNEIDIRILKSRAKELLFYITQFQINLIIIINQIIYVQWDISAFQVAKTTLKKRSTVDRNYSGDGTIWE